MTKLSKNFFSQDPAKVARNLLGCILIRKLNKKVISGKIVETEAYYGLKDPASRAFKGKTKISENMWKEAGTILIYMVHNHWLFNIVTGQKGKPQAVLIRALEPLRGIEFMKRKRKLEDSSASIDREYSHIIKKLASGPGKLTCAFGMTKEKYYGLNIAKTKDLFIVPRKENFKIATSKRIGVSHDLTRNLRFFVKGNKFISR